jgi:hypothetical protein
MGNSILFSEMRPEPSWEPEFNHWYDTEHIPVRMNAGGFESARRYRDPEHDNYLVIYELESRAALATPEYARIKNEPSAWTHRMLTSVHDFTRYLGDQMAVAGSTDPQALDAPVLFAVMFNVPESSLRDFDAWYEEDHIPILLECEDWLMVRRFDLVSGEPRPFNRLALHYLASPDALTSPVREKARNTPWRDRIAAYPWFKEGRYLVFGRHGEAQAAGHRAKAG